jgi:hypothetical protein
MMKGCNRCSIVVLGEPSLAIILLAPADRCIVKHDNANGATVQGNLYCNRLFTKSRLLYNWRTTLLERPSFYWRTQGCQFGLDPARSFRAILFLASM